MRAASDTPSPRRLVTMATYDDSTSPPFTPECELFYEGGPSPDQLCNNCEKNPRHPTFIPVGDFTIEHLPPECRDQLRMDYIQCWCDRTVKVAVRYTSLDRPDTYPRSSKPYPYSQLKGNSRVTRCGTGFISSYEIVNEKPCPCPLCKESTEHGMNRRYLMAKIETAVHVIYDDSEAANSTFECFYDSNNRENVKFLYGLNAHQWGIEDDSCEVLCVTHDEGLIKAMCDFMKKCTIKFLKDYGLIISHPHGRSKHITIGKFLYITSCITEDRFRIDTPREFEPGDRCRLTTDQIPTNFQQATGDNLPLDGVTTSPSREKQHTHDTRKNTISSRESTLSGHSPPLCLDSSKKLPLEFGVDYSFPPGTTFTLPQDSEYLYRCRDPSSSLWWVTFPPGTRYTWPDGTDIPLPDEVEFKVQVMNDYVLSIRPSYRSYAIDTCPGSSGAKVIFDRNRHPWSYALHAGSAPDGINRTGTRFFCFHNKLMMLERGTNLGAS